MSQTVQTMRENPSTIREVPRWVGWIALQLMLWFITAVPCAPLLAVVVMFVHASAWWATNDGMLPLPLIVQSVWQGLLGAALLALLLRGFAILNHHCRRPVWATRRRARNAASQPRLETLPPPKG